MNYTERFQVSNRSYADSSVAPKSPLSLFQGASLEQLLETELYGTSSGVWESCLLDPVKTFFKTPGKSLRRDFVELGWQIACQLSQKRTSFHQPYNKLTSQTPPCPEDLILLVEMLHSGSLIVDDIEDQSTLRRNQPCLHLQVGLAPALNVGNWLYFVSGHMIERLNCTELTKARLYAQLNRIMLRCHQGQAIDVSYKVTQLERYQIPDLTALSTRLKTGVLVGFASQLGALYLNLSEDICETLYRFGEQVGLGLQMYDDLSGIINDRRWHKGCEDISRQRLTWVWSWLAQHPSIDDDLFALMMDHVSKLAVNDNESVNELISSEEWQDHAKRLRHLISPYLEKEESSVRETISNALDNLKNTLGSKDAYLIASQAVVRLQNSYL